MGPTIMITPAMKRQRTIIPTENLNMNASVSLQRTSGLQRTTAAQLRGLCFFSTVILKRETHHSDHEHLQYSSESLQSGTISTRK